MEILITGVAGYIGAHIADFFLKAGYRVVGIDNLSTGKKVFIDSRVNFIEGNIQDFSTLTSAMKLISNPLTSGVIHCAGLKFAGESVKYPLSFYENNTFATLQLIKAMENHGFNKLVFSSSCSIYGNINTNSPITEENIPAPISPYGRSKLMAEYIIKDYVALGKIKAISLRYFNVAGNADIAAYDVSEFNVFPNIYRSLTSRVPFNVFGYDYATPDGTCIRDYVDVRSLTKAHYDAYLHIDDMNENYEIYNLGSGSGFSVGELVDRTRNLISDDFTVNILARRVGDPEKIWADVTKVRTHLGWQNGFSCEEMLMSGWEAWKRNSD